MRRQITERKTIFAIELCNKVALSKIYKELLKLSNKKMNKPVNKWAKDLNRQLTRKDIQMKNKHVKRCSTSYVIRELPIETVRYHYAPIRIAKLCNTENVKILVRLRDNKSIYTLLVGMQNGPAMLEDILEVSLKN